MNSEGPGAWTCSTGDSGHTRKAARHPFRVSTCGRAPRSERGGRGFEALTRIHSRWADPGGKAAFEAAGDGSSPSSSSSTSTTLGGVNRNLVSAPVATRVGIGLSHVGSSPIPTAINALRSINFFDNFILE